MNLGPGWAFVGLVVLGIAALLLVPGCGLVVVDEAPSGQSALAAPSLVELDASVEGRRIAVRTVSLARARRQVRGGVLRIHNPGCDGTPSGSGFALDARTLLAQRDVLPGASTVKVAPRKGRAKRLRAAQVFRLGELGIARVAGRLPRPLPVAERTALGASVAIVAYPLSARPRLLKGVVVDRVAGAPFGVRGRVLRITSALGEGEPGGPVVDARGRIVAVAFTTDPGSGLAVAVPVGALRSLAASKGLEAVPACDD